MRDLDKIQKNEPLHVQVFSLLKSKIITGEYEPGEIIVEAKLSEDLGVSRSPIREAIRLLEREGFIVKENNYKMVRKFSLKHIEDVYQCRRALDSLAAFLAAKNISKHNIKRMKESQELARKYKTEKKYSDIVKRNVHFHNIIIESANNKTLAEQYKSLSGLVLFYRNIYYKRAEYSSHMREQEFLDEHYGIIEAIENGDAELAEKRMKDHIESDIKDFLGMIKSTELSEESHIDAPKESLLK